MYTQPRSQTIVARPAGESDEGSDDDLDDFGYDMPGFRNKKVTQPLGNGVGTADGGAAVYEEDWGEASNSHVASTRPAWLNLSPIEEVRLACTRGDREHLDAALEKGEIDINYMFDDGFSPLMEAASNGQVDLVEYLVESKNADVDAFHYNMKITAVMAAVSCSVIKPDGPILPCLKILVEKGNADVNKQDKFGTSALIIAVKKKLRPVVQYLLEHGADPNLADNQGRSGLFYAAEEGDGRMCRLLLENKADIFIVDDAGWSAPELANDKGHFSLGELLHIVRDTKWIPGLNPKLMQEVDETAVDRMKERARDGLSVKEDTQLELLLTSLNADKYIEVFRKHKVSYVQFLVLEEEHLKEMGVDDVGTRLKLVDAIRETHNTRWANSSLNMVAVNKKVTSAEAVCIVENIKTHVDHISATLRSLRNRIAKDPKNLKLGKEHNKIQDLISFIVQMRDSNEILRKDVVNLLQLFLEIKDFAEFRLGDEAKPLSVDEFIKQWKKQKMSKTRGKKPQQDQTVSKRWNPVRFGIGSVAVIGLVSAFIIWNQRGK